MTRTDRPQVIILAGGLGTRLAEETELKPKPMVEVGERPIIWHICKHYGHFGFNEFFVALGYRGEVLKRYFLDYAALAGDISLNTRTGEQCLGASRTEDWLVHLVDTGARTMTGGRVKRLQRRLEPSTFMVTYGDGVSNVNLDELLAFHYASGRLATVTAVRPPARFGGLRFDGNLVVEFTEKSQISEGWINGGYLVFEPGIFDYLSGDESSLEVDLLERLAADGQLAAFRHEGFWQCMDTLRDKRMLDERWRSGAAPWKVWSE